MKLTFLGTGSSVGTPVIGCKCDVCMSKDSRDHRLRTSALIEVDGLNIQVDVGPDFRQQTLLYNPNANIDAVILTHGHSDHIIGLDDLRPLNFIKNMIIPMYADESTLKNIFKMFFYHFDSSYRLKGRFNINEISDKPFYINKQKIIPIKVIHNKEILAYRINDVTYITDAKYISDKEIDKIKGSRILVVNALSKKKHSVHFSLDEALEFIELIKPEKAYLTHISHQLGRHETIQENLPENVQPAYDGLVVS